MTILILLPLVFISGFLIWVLLYYILMVVALRPISKPRYSIYRRHTRPKGWMPCYERVSDHRYMWTAKLAMASYMRALPYHFEIFETSQLQLS